MGQVAAAMLANERALADWWRAGGAAGSTLIADDGSRWQVRYPGRPNHDAGPDFVDAVLQRVNGPLVRSAAVELHRAASDWEQHGHATNRRYNHVTLHVVLHDDRPGIPTMTTSGHRIPRVAVDPSVVACPSHPLEPTPGLWVYGCRTRGAAGQNPAQAARVINVAGDARLAWLTRSLRGDLRRAAAAVAPEGDAAIRQATEQVLYEWIADALGFSQNRDAMRNLAHRVPLADLRRIGPRSGDRATRLANAAAHLLSAAGLIAAINMPPIAQQLSLFAPNVSPVPPVSATQVGRKATSISWRLDRSRPGNAPVRRIVALAALALTWPARGLGPTVVALLRHGRPTRLRRASGRPRPPGTVLAQLVQRPAPAGIVAERLRQLGGWWPARAAAALIGPGRAADIVVNVLIPYGLAAARDGPEGLGRAARGAYLSHPPLASNWIIRLMSERTGFEPRTAREQQGLIWLYEQHSHGLFCSRCPLSRR